MSKPCIAFVGLGAMGMSMAKVLLRAGYDVQGFDIRPEAITALYAENESGASRKQATSVQQAAEQAEVLIIMTVNDEQARRVLFEERGIHSLANGATVIQMGTCSKEACIQLAKEAKEVRPDVGFVDAPVSGGQDGAKTGGLTIMAAADADVFAKVQPVLQTMGSKLYHIGSEVGQGSAMKAVNQVLCGIHLAAAAEALNLACASGIEPSIALEIVQGSAASSWMLQHRAPRMIPDQEPEEVKSAVDLFNKDLGIVLQTGKQVGAPLPLSNAAARIFAASRARGDGAKDDSQVIKAYQARDSSLLK